MLIASPRHTAKDLAHWKVLEAGDAFRARTTAFRSLERQAKADLRRFIEEAPGVGYVGVSWGKDSVCVAHLAWQLAQEGGPSLPLVWVRVRGKENPDCPLVRDAFLAAHPGLRYEEIEVDAPDVGLTSSLGFDEAARRHGDRHVSGVRGAESKVRKLRALRWGTNSAKTCAPITWWSTEDVYAYLHREGLPAHPAYACTMGGTYDRTHLRVAAIGGSRGTEFGRGDWERRYYPEVTSALRAAKW